MAAAWGRAPWRGGIIRAARPGKVRPMFAPKTVEEVRTVEHFRAVTALRAEEKRRKIAQLAAALDTAAHLPPHQAVGLLGNIWDARRSLDWGCRTIVGR